MSITAHFGYDVSWYRVSGGVRLLLVAVVGPEPGACSYDCVPPSVTYEPIATNGLALPTGAA